MLELTSGWQLHVDYSVDWIFVRIEQLGSENVEPPIADSLWGIA